MDSRNFTAATAWPDFAFNYTQSTQSLSSSGVVYLDEDEGAINVLIITTAIICLLLMLVAYLIHRNLLTWSQIMQEKHLKMLRDREYVLLRAYCREMQFSRLMQEIPEEEHANETTVE